MAGIDAIDFPDRQRLRQRTCVRRARAPEWRRLDVCTASVGVDVISAAAEPGNTIHRPDDCCSAAMTDTATLTGAIRLRGVSVFAEINLHRGGESGVIAWIGKTTPSPFSVKRRVIDVPLDIIRDNRLICPSVSIAGWRAHSPVPQSCAQKPRAWCMKPTILMLLVTCALGLVSCGGGGGFNPAPTPSGPSAQVFVTTGDEAKLLAPQSQVTFGTGGSQNSPVITLTETTRYQTIDGFGGSLTDSAAWVIWNDLDAVQRAALMQQLFSPTAGIGLSFLRQPMGATDFSVSGNYSYDDVPAGQTDPLLLNFSVAHDAAYIIPLL